MHGNQGAAIVEVTPKYVSYAIKALPLLGKSAREAIYGIPVKSGIGRDLGVCKGGNSW